MAGGASEGSSAGPPSGTPLQEVRSFRFLPAGAERVVNAALSRGPGYEPTPIGSSFAVDEVQGYFMDFSAKTRSPAASDVPNLLPAPLAQLALGWWERRLAGEPGAPDQFLAVCRVLEARGEQGPDGIRWWHHVEVAKYRIRGPWCSALAQSQAASVFLRAHRLTGDSRYERLARGALAPLLSHGPSDLVRWTPHGPVLQEAPALPASHILNGWISALWGLHELVVTVADEPVSRSLEASVEALRAHLPLYDAGGWSRYSLYPHALEDLAKPIYHQCHVTQLTVMHRLTGASEFSDMAKRWADSYDARHITYALAQKGLFALAERRRRHHAPR